MKHQSKFGVACAANIASRRDIAGAAMMGSRWDIECRDREGNLKWACRNNPNVMTNEGLNHILNAILHGSAQISPWYVVPFENDYTPQAGDTYAVPGYTECTAYNETGRVEFNEAEATSQSVTNSANKATFNMNATKTIYGAGLVGGGSPADSKGDTGGGGTLLCAARFSSSKPCESGDTLKITAAVSAQNVS